MSAPTSPRRTHIDRLGRVQLTSALIRYAGMDTRAWVEMWVEGDQVILMPVQRNRCILCGGLASTQYRDRWLCSACRQDLQELAAKQGEHEHFRKRRRK